MYAASSQGAPPTCGTRYAELSIPENGLAYEMMSQIATLLKTGGSNSPLPSGFQVRHLIHVGESQQAGSLVTYASAFHLDGVNDGYFIQAVFGDGQLCVASTAGRRCA